MELEKALEGGVLLSRLDKVLGWARKYSIFQYPFVTACCGMEYMSTACSHYDIDRFGAGLPRFSPRQADVLFVVGTISHKIAPVLVKIYEQMCEPKWVVAFGVCTVSGGFYDNYATILKWNRSTFFAITSLQTIPACIKQSPTMDPYTACANSSVLRPKLVTL